MPKHNYQLINPIIEGTFKDVYDAKKPIEAADAMWNNFTEHIVSHVPKFMFTMKDISSGSLHHFDVVESKQDSSYTISNVDIKAGKKEFDNFTSRVDSYSKTCEQKGGGKRKRKRYDDSHSDSDDSSSEDIYPTIRRTSPIAMFHYNPGIYYNNMWNNNIVTEVSANTMNPQLVQVNTPIFTPIFRPNIGTFVGIWPWLFLYVLGVGISNNKCSMNIIHTIKCTIFMFINMLIYSVN